MDSATKQLTLRPQDLLVTLKVAVNQHRSFRLTDLADELSMALSAVHGSITRSEVARLLSRSAGSIRPLRPSVYEFVVHGAKYCFPGVLGTLSRGVPTSVAGPVLRSQFEGADALPPVWPDPEGQAYGPAVQPLHSVVPAAARRDLALYEVLSLLDALRIGAARERELAVGELKQRLA